MQSGWRLAQQNSAFIENSFTNYRIQDLDFYQVFFIDKQWWKKKKSAIHMTADLQNCSKSLQTENQSQLGGLGTLT